MPVHHRLRLLAFPMRTRRGIHRVRSGMRSPGSLTRSVCTCQGLRPRRVVRALAIACSCVLPSVLQTTSAPGTMTISRLDGWPMHSPADASPPSSRTPTHGSGPVWGANPSPKWTFTIYSLPVSRRTCKRLSRPGQRFELFKTKMTPYRHLRRAGRRPTVAALTIVSPLCRDPRQLLSLSAPSHPDVRFHYRSSSRLGSGRKGVARGGQASDSTHFETLLDIGLDIAPRAVPGDKGYSSKPNRGAARTLGVAPVIRSELTTGTSRRLSYDALDHGCMGKPSDLRKFIFYTLAAGRFSGRCLQHRFFP